MSFIASLKENVVKDSIKLLLHKKLVSWSPARDPQNLHASAVTKQEMEFCPREVALYQITGYKPKDEMISTVLRVCFDHGHDVAWRMNNDWLRDVMVGDWKCSKCGLLRKFSSYPGTTKCLNHTTACDWEYREVRFTSKITSISCGIDGFIQFPEKKLKIVEIKTIARDMFESIKTPLAEHRLRTRLYMRTIEESGAPEAAFIDLTEAHILYVIKGFGVKDPELEKLSIADSYMTPFKEFIVKREDTETDPYVQKAMHVVKFRTDAVMPEAICPTMMCKRAKKCAVAKACFSGKYPAGVKGFK